MKIVFENNMSGVYGEKSFCPYLKKPFDDCYCVKMSSQDIERAIYFCTKDFKTCEIYNNFNFGKDVNYKKNNASH
jgi:hypothetical protein